MPQEIHPYSVLLRPLVTEKSTTLAGRNQYVFEVDLRANKHKLRNLWSLFLMSMCSA